VTRAHRIVVATADTIGERMAGPAIRAWNIAAALAEHHEVHLISTGACTIGGAGFEVVQVDEADIIREADWCEVFISQGWVLAGRPRIVASEKVIVCDIYDPMHLEQLEQARFAGATNWKRAVHGANAALNHQIRRGDFFVCASEKQRDFWLGQLAGMGRINPATYQRDGALRRLIDVVPFGTPDQPPAPARSAIRGVLPGVTADSQVILWGGGVYNWFDPLTLIRAVAALHRRHPEVRLVFMGLTHPNPEIPQMRVAVEAQRLAAELGLTGTVVHFNEGWVPYDRRAEFLCDADIGVSTHFDHVETEFSFRTRILDYLWVGLPIVATGGDSFGALIESVGAGMVVPAQDEPALERALERLLTDRELAKRCGEASRLLGEDLRWSRVLQPLLEFCSRPERAPDLLDEEQRKLAHSDLVMSTTTGGRLRTDLVTLKAYWREGGIRTVWANARRRLRRVLHLPAAEEGP
jgi:glycosyltransferase involved in cell wall biosynthesis